MQNPRQIMKSVLQGTPPERPLVVPIVFSLGARIENLAPRAYLENATKITNALRQVRTQLRTDGVACYFDPLLEMEALGGVAKWDATNQIRTIEWPEPAAHGELPARLRSPEDAASSPRVKVAVEVIRRLNSLLRDEPLLMAGVSGPFTLAARLTQREAGAETLQTGDVPESALEVAAAAITKIAAALVEAGANLIFIREEILPPLSPERCESWAGLLAPVFNIVRFYDALPVLHLASGEVTERDSAVIRGQRWDAVLCSSSADFLKRAANCSDSCGAGVGVALPLEMWEPGETQNAFLQNMAGARPVLLTTDGDVPAQTDVKQLMAAFEAFARHL